MANTPNTTATEERELTRREMIALSLQNRGIELSQREINLAILYSCCDTAYHRRDDTHTLTAEGCTAAINAAVERYRKYERPTVQTADIA